MSTPEPVGLDSGWRDVVAAMNTLDDARQALVDAVDEHAVVLALGAIPSTHRLAVAARLALESRVAREERARAEKEIAVAISGAADWTRIAARHVTYVELRRRRAQVPQ